MGMGGRRSSLPSSAPSLRAIRHLRQIDPLMCVSNLKDWIPFRRPQDLNLFADGLRKAGLPE
jgi:hypothetical protein